MLKKYLKPSIVTSILIFVAIFVLANCSGHHHDPKARAEYMVKKLIDKLELDETQKAKLIKIKDEILAKRKSMHSNRKAIISKVIDQIKSDKIDQDELNKIFKANSKNRTEMRKFLIQKFAEFHEILSPKQRLKLVELVEKFSKKFHK
ncbi:MAG: Spy/CpxP family protein refolding chaperone [Spirochaetota bacterium]|nr:Spy/CpxP family protein refolding chaperone [Spirochaetota bacterium]